MKNYWLWLVLTLYLPATICGYSDEFGHPQITREVCRYYNSVLPNQTKQLTEEDIKNICQGSYDEDHPSDRSVNHFLNPINNKGYDLRFSISVLNSVPTIPFHDKAWDINGRCGKFASTFIPANAVDWAITPGLQSAIPYCDDESWPTVLFNFSNNRRDRAMKALGHILHLMEDMTVPDHTRNDPHITGLYYESYVKAKIQDLIASGRTLSLFDPMRSITFFPKPINDIRQCFTEIAFYTATHFLSNDTVRSPDHPKPPIVAIEESTIQNGPVTDHVCYLIAKDDDGSRYRVARLPTSYSARSSLPTEVPIGSSLSKETFEDAWTRSSRHCLQYGAGVIGLFFTNATPVTTTPPTTTLSNSIVYLARTENTTKVISRSSNGETTECGTFTGTDNHIPAENPRWDINNKTLLVDGETNSPQTAEAPLGTFAVDLERRTITQLTQAVPGPDRNWSPKPDHLPYLGQPYKPNQYFSIDIQCLDPLEEIPTLVDRTGKIIRRLKSNPLANSQANNAKMINLPAEPQLSISDTSSDQTQILGTKKRPGRTDEDVYLFNTTNNTGEFLTDTPNVNETQPLFVP